MCVFVVGGNRSGGGERMSTRSEIISAIQERLRDLQINGTAKDESEMMNLVALLETLSMEEEEATLAEILASSTPEVSDSPFVEPPVTPPPPPAAPVPPAADERTVYTEDQLRSMSESEILAAVLRSEQEVRARSDSFEDVHSDLCPFDVKCPFCGGIMPTFNFPDHVFTKHSDRAGEKHRCGICYLTSNTSLGKVALVEHLRTEHSDFVVESEPTFVIGYNNEVIDKDCTGECPICLEPYLAGQTMTILSCLCRYHQKCIEGYWKTDGHKPGDCPVHRDRDTLIKQ